MRHVESLIIILICHTTVHVGGVLDCNGLSIKIQQLFKIRHQESRCGASSKKHLQQDGSVRYAESNKPKFAIWGIAPLGRGSRKRGQWRGASAGDGQPTVARASARVGRHDEGHCTAGRRLGQRPESYAR